MVAASRAKASDRAALLKKLFPIIKKHYKLHIPKGGKPVLETMLYAICLEDAPVEEADTSFKQLFAEFPDLNEVRVSTVGEIERAFHGQTASEWRAYRTISVLKFVFDKNYGFEFESLRKKTLDLASKQLAKIKELSQFVRDYTLHDVTGSHLIPIDTAMARLLTWLGLVPPNQTPEHIGELMKGAIRKAEIETAMFTLRCLATDRKMQPAFDPVRRPVPEAGFDLDSAVARLNDLLKKGGEKAGKPTAAPKSSAKKEPVAPAAKSKSSSKLVKTTTKPPPVKHKKAPAAKKVVKKSR